MNPEVTWQALRAAALLPEIFLALVACAVLLCGAFQSAKQSGARIACALSTASLIAVAAWIALDFADSPQLAMHGMFIDDALADLLKITICLTSACAFIYGREYNRARGVFQAEYYALGLFAVIGMLVMASASHLLTLYLGLELMSLSLYAMIAFYRDGALAVEAAMKYFVLGALASGVLLYGMSLLYGLGGSLHLSDIATALSLVHANDQLAVALAVVFIVVALAFKIGAAPFHMWLPDVYHGAPTSTTAFIAAAPKIAAFAVLMRLLVGGLEELHAQWRPMLIILAVLSLAVGNIIAIAQRNLKRMLAYSTISHMGFFLFGILSGTAAGYAASLFYVIAYAVMSLAAFALVLYLAHADDECDELSDLKGLGKRSPFLALLVLILMLSLAGVPPTLGFFAKLTVIQALINAGLVWLAVFGVVLAVVGAFYYLRAVKLAWFDPPEDSRPFVNDRPMKILFALNVLLLPAILPWLDNLLAICHAVIRQF